MKVLMTTDTVGGVWTYAVQLANALRPYGVEIALATQGVPLTADQRAEVELLDNVLLFESTYRLEWMKDAEQDIADAGDWLLEIAASVEPDVVHLNDYCHASLPWEAPVIVVGHSCVCSWFQEVVHTMPGPEWNHYRRRVRSGLQSADMVIAPTLTMLQWLEGFYGPLNLTRVIGNGRDSLPAQVAVERDLIFTAGRLWDQAKNIETVVRAAKQLRRPVHAASISLPGERQCDLTGVQFRGRLTPAEMWATYSRAAVFVLPARYEPFGLAPLEAALCGCALVLGDIPTLREVWGNAALFVKPDDDAQLATAVNSLIDNPSLLHRYQRAARSRAADFGSIAMAENYLHAYRELVGATHLPFTLGATA